MMTIRWQEQGGQWWVHIDGRWVTPINLSSRATDTELRMMAEQTIAEMVKEARIVRGAQS